MFAQIHRVQNLFVQVVICCALIPSRNGEVFKWFIFPRWFFCCFVFFVFFFSSEFILDITFNSCVALFSKKWARTRVALGVCFVSVGSSVRVGDRSVCAARRCYVLLGEILHSSIRSVLQYKPCYRFCLLSRAVHLSVLFLSLPSAFELQTGQN